MEVLCDYRLGNTPRYYLGEENDSLMQVPDEVRKCVVFLQYKNKNTKADTLAGTAFFVAKREAKEEELGLDFVYLITAKHVIDGIKEKSLDGIVYIRVNQINKASRLVRSSIDQWKFHPTLSEPHCLPSFVDVAVLPWSPNQEIYDCLLMPARMAMTQETLVQQHIGCGDEVFITGLFTEHFGLQRNLPIIRMGNIASMPEEPVLTPKYGAVDAYLVEARSIGGLSGSPVFVHLGMSRVFDGTLKTAKNPIYYWLGLIHGHFDFKDMDIGDTTIQDNLYNLSINMGIAIVVPVSRILEVLNQDELIKYRQTRDEAYRQSKAATPDII